MEDADDGWQTVMPTSHFGIDRIAKPQLEVYERQILRDWDTSKGHWSGIGKHTSALDFTEAKRIHPRFRLAPDKVLGAGTYGVVEKVHYSHNNRSVCLARKWIQYRRGRTIQTLREEAHVMEKLDHEHIVKLVGTYTLRPNELYLLLWPVAICNLDCFFNDLDCLRTGQGDRDDIFKRFEVLQLKDLSVFGQRQDGSSLVASKGTSPLKYLQQIMGCITQAVAYCHNENIRHLDLKPSNILLNPGRVYLADFGIARDVNDRDHTMTFGLQGTPKWRAPEMCDPNDEWSMKKADVYSLGLILLNIETAIYSDQMVDFDNILDDLALHTRAPKLADFQKKLALQALATQEVSDCNAHTVGPRHVLGLTRSMLSLKPCDRPTVDQVNTELVELGGFEQVYHSPCCKKASRIVQNLVDTRYRIVVGERDRLAVRNQDIAKRLEVLNAKDETYELRIQNQAKRNAEIIAKLQDQLEKERKERERLENLLMEHQQDRRRRPQHGIPGPASYGTHAVNGNQSVSSQRPRTHSNNVMTVQSSVPRPMAPSGSNQKSNQISAFPSSLKRPGTAQATSAAISPSTYPTPLPNMDAAAAASISRNGSPTTAGYPMRPSFSGTRLSSAGSRLPRAVNPSTPIRASTPILNRDPSMTDSTQFSMASSTFSRTSANSRDSDSPNPTPATGSPALNKSIVEQKPSPARPNYAAAAASAAVKPSVTPAVPLAQPPVSIPQHTAPPVQPLAPPNQPSGSISVSSSNEPGVGLGLSLLEALEGSTTASLRDATSIRDTASIASGPSSRAPMPGAASPILTGSAFSSPRMAKAELEPGSSTTMRVPSLPTAKSWADVARRQRRP